MAIDSTRPTVVIVDASGNIVGATSNALDVNVKSITGSTIPVTQSGTWDEVGINDSGNSITVDAPVGTPVFVRLSDGAAALVGQQTMAASLPVTLASNQTTITTGGAKTNNALASGANNMPTLPALANAAAPSWTEDRVVHLSTDLSGNLRVTGAGGGTQYTEADTDASITGTAVMWEDAADTLRAVSAAKPLPIGDAGGSLTVDNGGTFVVQENGAALTALQLIDDTVYTDDTSTHATGTSKGVGIMAAAVPTDTSVSANDIAMVGMTTDRRMYVEASIAATQTLSTVTTVSTVTALGAGTTGPMKAEDAGHSTGDQGFPAWGVRVDSPNAALTSTDADYSPIGTNKLGSIRVAPMEDDLATAATKHVSKYYTNAGAVTDGIIWSPAAGTRWFVTSLTINTSAAATVTIEDDLAGGDVVRLKFEFAANSGITIPFPEVPLFSGEDAADLMVTTSAGNIYITAVGYEI